MPARAMRTVLFAISLLAGQATLVDQSLANEVGNPHVTSPGPSFNQAVKIHLRNGEIISFTADWNFGLGVFVMDYERFLSNGVKQPNFRYQMQDKDRKTNAHVNLKFEEIAALHLQKM